ncbi:hypothetical protein TD95_003204 [Thielaviopsis punctulata]|uniref:DNA damage-inducible protein 1 n=1 Tax=Thielaviopsis punctulata TaxID=72032 RepID=A0A0F4ZAM6_9PEZI|nr:hypothetical protein TD95_003204 [Thielaviopsis punctulata]
MTLETLRESIRTETQIPVNSQHIYHNGRLVTDATKTLQEIGVVDGDMLAVHVRDMQGSTGIPESRRPGAPSQRRVPDSSTAGGSGSDNTSNSSSAQIDPEFLRMQILRSPEMLAHLQRTNPALAQALNDPARFAGLIHQNVNRDSDERRARQDQINRWNADPFDVESQARIEEMIRQERVMENLQNAMEYNPEVFGRVHMLYLDVVINGKTVKAMVDSGAQATVMSPSCAEECGIMRLVDKRFSGVARGVGTANIIGRVHLFQIKIGNLFLPCSFTVMEGKSVDLLLGLDMLKRHQATIDLARDRLIIQGEEVAFLGEAEIPKGFGKEDDAEDAKVEGPAGTTIDSRSGAVEPPHSAQAGPSGQHSQPSAPTAPIVAPAPAQATVSAPVVAPQASSGRSGFPEESIQQLMDLGFPREGAIHALQAAGGNVEIAAGLLFGA